MDIRKSVLTMAFLLTSVASFSDEYFVSVNGKGTGDGLSWDNALPFTMFCSNIDEYKNGDTFYFQGGTYYPSKRLDVTFKGYTLIGGFSDSLSGTDKTLPDYPSATPTVFSADYDKDGSTANNLKSIFFFKHAKEDKAGHGDKDGDDSLAVRIKGIEFTGAYDTNADNQHEGALLLRGCGYVQLDNCVFSNNYYPYGGSAITSQYSHLVANNCEFYNNTAGARGAIRCSSNSGSKGYLLLNGCYIHNNSVTGGTGSAICIQHGMATYIINSIITGNTAGSSTGAIYSNGSDNTFSRNLYIINSTISGNTGGPQVQMTTNANLYVANSIIVGDDSNKAFYIVSKKDFSGSYNIVGTDSTTTLTWGETNSTGNTVADVFVSDSIAKGPKDNAIPYGATSKELSTAVDEWGLPTDVNLNVDINGATRDTVSVPGAVVAKPKEADEFTVTDAGYATYYNSNGFVMPDGLTGAIVSGATGNKLSIDYKYNAGYAVPAKTALLLKGTAGKYTPALKLAAASTETNLLRGSDTETETTGGTKYYKLANDSESGIGFYWGADNGAYFMSDAHKAYLALNGTSATAKGFRLDNTTAINTLQSSTIDRHNQDIYNLNGQRVPATTKGMIIINGKKFINK